MALPNDLALTTIADGSPLIASPVRNNFADTQTAVNGLIADLDDGAIDGDALVWDATNGKWSAASKLASTRPRAARVWVGTIAAGPPASPVDMDIWVATAVDANGTRWAFQYNAGSSSSYKWEFIGGIPTQAAKGGGTIASSSGSWAAIDTSNLRITVARGGDYHVRGNITFQSSGASTNFFGIGIFVNGSETNDLGIETPLFTAANQYGNLSGERLVNNTAASAHFDMSVNCQQSLSLDQAFFALAPIRVS